MSFQYFPTLVLFEQPVIAPVTARALLILNLAPVHEDGFRGEDTPTSTVMRLHPGSATAAAYRFGANRLAFDLDAVLSSCDGGRHRLAEDHVTEYSAPVLVETGGHGESHEDNRDMVDNSELAVA